MNFLPLHPFALIPLLLAITARVGAEPTAIDAPRDVSTTLAAVLRHQRLPGLAAVVLRDGHMVAEGVAGVRKAGAPERLTLDDEFLLCSSTKAMTATLVAMAVEDGKLSYHTTLGEIFTNVAKPFDPAWKTVNVAQLLEHRAGVPTEGSCFWTLLRVHFSHDSVTDQRARVVAKILSRAPRYPPGTKYLYTALDYVILGAMLNKVTGHSWEELMQERLWQPLGITTGGFGAPEGKKKMDVPWGHWGTIFDGCPIAPGGFWSKLSMPLFMGPGGAVHMTITDWAKFIELHLRGDPENSHREVMLLKPESFARLHEADPGKTYQAGWYLGKRSWAKGPRPGNTGRVLASQGDNGFWHAEAWLAPERDFAVLIICNQGGVGNKPAAKVCARAMAILIHDFLSNDSQPLEDQLRPRANE